jgi:hypothetical protein
MIAIHRETSRRRDALQAIAAIALISGAGSPALAGETVVYTYDELGRLIKSVRSGDTNNGVATDIEYDPAGNRVEYVVSGASGSGNFPTEDPPSFSISSNKTTSEGGVLTFTVNRSPASNVTYSVSWSTRTNSADESDFVAGAGTLTFAPQDTSKSITIQTNQDLEYEANETFFVDLTGASAGATLGVATRTGTILNDDSDPASNNPPVANPDSGAVNTCGFESINVIENDADPDGDAIRVVAVGTSGKGSTGHTSSNVTFSAFGGTSGNATITYTIEDAKGAQAQSTVTIAIANTTAVCQ